jgi:hypothetical protein
MYKRLLALGFLTCVLGFNSANALPVPSPSGGNGANSSIAPQPVNGWWLAVPLVIGGIVILEHEHHRYGRRCYRC